MSFARPSLPPHACASAYPCRGGFGSTRARTIHRPVEPNGAARPCRGERVAARPAPRATPPFLRDAGSNQDRRSSGCRYTVCVAATPSEQKEVRACPAISPPNTAAPSTRQRPQRSCGRESRGSDSRRRPSASGTAGSSPFAVGPAENHTSRATPIPPTGGRASPRERRYSRP